MWGWRDGSWCCLVVYSFDVISMACAWMPQRRAVEHGRDARAPNHDAGIGSAGVFSCRSALQRSIARVEHLAVSGMFGSVEMNPSVELEATATVMSERCLLRRAVPSLKPGRPPPRETPLESPMDAASSAS